MLRCSHSMPCWLVGSATRLFGFILVTRDSCVVTDRGVPIIEIGKRHQTQKIDEDDECKYKAFALYGLVFTRLLDLTH